MMTRKDYVAVAEILSDHGDWIPSDEFASMVNAFADLMAEDNERFLRERFIDACYEWRLVE